MEKRFVIRACPISALVFEQFFKFFHGSNKKLPIHEKLNHAKLKILKSSSLSPSSGLKFQNLAKNFNF